MAEIIKDGTGAGYTARVNNANQLDVFAVTEPEDKFLNKNGGVWTLYFEVTPAGANDYFFYLKNTGTAVLSISDIRVHGSVATELYYKKVSGTPSYITGTEPSITNRNLGSSSSPTITAKYDTDITGLTDEGVLFFENIAAANTRYKLSTSSNIIIPSGSAVAFQRVAATGLIGVAVSLIDITIDM